MRIRQRRNKGCKRIAYINKRYKRYHPAKTPDMRRKQYFAIKKNIESKAQGEGEKKKKSKPSKGRWNKVHFFLKRKSSNLVGHPSYIYARRGRVYKYLLFTHKPPEGEEDNFELLKHNIDPEKDGVEQSYVKKKFEVNRDDAFELPEKNYRIHDEDVPIIKKYKK